MSQTSPNQNRIQLLPEVLSNQIAAGEVVERPASVVKELVENALDAGATRVFVDVEDGGRARIKVVDDGVGMSREDALMSILRHATSKITVEADLHGISTLGFRGEALPSIASVSHFTLTTRTQESNAGTKLVVRGGIKEEPMDVGAPIGTTIDVRDLFYNVPARLKFMKSKGTEMNHINHLITGFALGHPHVHFRLTHNGRKTGDYPKERNLKARIYSVLGSKACSRLYETQLEADIHVRGFLSDPGYTRAGTQGVYTFINGRQVRDKLLLRAITASFGHMLERGRYPHAVLYLSVPVDWVDVNVHPTKHEVRFVQGGRVFECVTRALKMTLEAAPWKEAELSASGAPDSANLHLWSQTAPSTTAGNERKWSGFPPPSRPMGNNGASWAPTGTTSHGMRPPEQASAPGFTLATYWIARDNGSLTVIHQKRALSFLIFTELERQGSEGEIPRQRLLFPEQFDITGKEKSWLESHEALLPCGLVLEPFGETTAVLKEIPLPLAGRGGHTALVKKLLKDKIEDPRKIRELIALFCSDGDWTPLDQQRLEEAYLNGDIPSGNTEYGVLSHQIPLAELDSLFTRGR